MAAQVAFLPAAHALDDELTVGLAYPVGRDRDHGDGDLVEDPDAVQVDHDVAYPIGVGGVEHSSELGNPDKPLVAGGFDDDLRGGCGVLTGTHA